MIVGGLSAICETPVFGVLVSRRIRCNTSLRAKWYNFKDKLGHLTLFSEGFSSKKHDLNAVLQMNLFIPLVLDSSRGGSDLDL
jgi:hypothetical protein